MFPERGPDVLPPGTVLRLRVDDEEPRSAGGRHPVEVVEGCRLVHDRVSVEPEEAPE
jgi:hypothetical protein